MNYYIDIISKLNTFTLNLSFLFLYFLFSKTNENNQISTNVDQKSDIVSYFQ